MSHYDYKMSQKISAQDPPFYALLMACFRKADTNNLVKLSLAFPAVWAEYNKRYHSPEGLIGDELLDRVVSELPETILGRKVVVTEASPTKFNITLGDYDIEGWARDREEPDETLSSGSRRDLWVRDVPTRRHAPALHPNTPTSMGRKSVLHQRIHSNFPAVTLE